MDNMRRGEGHPHNNTGESKNKNQPPIGFEGMNYEQKRKPYTEGSNADKARNEHPTNTSGRKMREDP